MDITMPETFKVVLIDSIQEAGQRMNPGSFSNPSKAAPPQVQVDPGERREAKQAKQPSLSENS